MKRTLLNFLALFIAITSFAQTAPPSYIRNQKVIIENQTGDRVVKLEVKGIIDSVTKRVSISEVRSMSGRTITDGKYFYTVNKGQEGFWRYDPSDSTSPDNTGTCLVTADNKRIKRVLTSSESVNVTWFGAKGNYDKTSKTGTDDTNAFLAAIDYMDKSRKSSLFLPEGNYLVRPVLFVNFGGSRPFSLIGGSGKPHTSTSDVNGASIFVNQSGDLFKINLNSDGSSFAAADAQYTSFSVRGVSFYCSETADVNIFKMFRTAATIQDVAVDGARWLVLQENEDSQGVGNYCDKSLFNNIKVNNAKLGGFRLCKADNTALTNISFEGARFIYQKGIEAVASDGLILSNLLCWYREDVTPIAGSAFLNLVNCSAVKVSGLHLERSPFSTWINISGCVGLSVSEVFTKFTRRNGISISGESKGVNVRGWFSFDNVIAGNYDLVVGSTAVGVSYSDCYFASSPDKVFRDINISQGNISQLRPISTPKTTALVTTAAYTLQPNGSVILGTIPSDTPLKLSSFVNHLGKEITIYNANSGAGRWYLVDPITNAVTFVKDADGMDLSYLKNQRVYTFEAASTTNNGWRLKSEYTPEAYYDGKYPQYFTSSGTATTKANLNAAYGTFAAGTRVAYPNYTGGARIYTKSDKTNTSDWTFQLATVSP